MYRGVTGRRSSKLRTEGGAFRALLTLCAVSFVLAGCAALHTPDNKSPLLYDPEKSTIPGRLDNGPNIVPSFSHKMCPPPGTTQYLASSPKPRSKAVLDALAMRYSAGDRFNLQVPGAQEYNGDYAINADGKIILPFAGEVPAVGLTNKDLTGAIERAFVRAKLFQAEGFKVAVRPVQYSAVNVSITGAVFLPGRYQIGNRENDKGDRGIGKFGDNPLDRSVSSVVRSANGVRPDADISRIKLVRGGKTMLLDWTGAMTGTIVDDVPLIDGDHIEIAETGCFQSALMRPSQLSPPGIRLFLSNLSEPSRNNAGAAISRDSTSVPYGTRFLAALVSAGCVGGIIPTNARRHAILISRNPKTHRTEVIQRSVEQLVLSADRDEINPYLMPDDAIACYDSDVTASRDIASMIQQFIVPRATWRGTN
jgi:polysaccharide biosynthesis/export protein